MKVRREADGKEKERVRVELSLYAKANIPKVILLSDISKGNKVEIAHYFTNTRKRIPDIL